MKSVEKIFSNKLNTVRSSHRKCTVKKGVLRNFAKFTGKITKNIFFTEHLRTTASVLYNMKIYGPCKQKFAKYVQLLYT